MGVQRTHQELVDECRQRSIEVPSGKQSKQQLIDLLAAHSLTLREYVGWGLEMRMAMESPMLCYPFKHLREDEKAEIMDSVRWIAEQKFDGCRMPITYHPDEGFRFFSRNISLVDYLPVEYTEKIVLIKGDKVMRPWDFKGTFKKCFVVDSEVTTDNPNIDTTIYRKSGVVTGTELNAVSAILAMNTEDSIHLQLSQASLDFNIFDLMVLGDSGWESQVWNLPLHKRKDLLSTMMNVLETRLPFVRVEYVSGKDKQEFYDQLISDKREGIILKNLDAPYVPRDTHHVRGHQVKLKRNMRESAGQDLDLFILGAVPAKKGKGWEDYIGGLKLGVYLRNGDESQTEIHWLATVAAIPLELRKRMTITGPDGSPDLDPEFLRKVVVVNGQDVSSKSLRFMHATIDWKRGFRNSKNYLDCVLPREFITSHVM